MNFSTLSAIGSFFFVATTALGSCVVYCFLGLDPSVFLFSNNQVSVPLARDIILIGPLNHYYLLDSISHSVRLIGPGCYNYALFPIYPCDFFQLHELISRTQGFTTSSSLGFNYLCYSSSSPLPSSCFISSDSTVASFFEWYVRMRY